LNTLHHPQNRRRRGSSMAEFGPALFVFLLIIAFPLINLLAFAMGYASLYFLTSQCAIDASNAPSFKEARAKMVAKAQQITGSGIGQFAKLVPQGGYQGSGTSLFITVTSLGSSTPTEYGPDTGYSGTVDDTNNIYEYTVKSTFNVGPFLNLGGVPGLGSIPIVGGPVLVNCSSHRAIEHTNSLN